MVWLAEKNSRLTKPPPGRCSPAARRCPPRRGGPRRPNKRQAHGRELPDHIIPKVENPTPTRLFEVAGRRRTFGDRGGAAGPTTRGRAGRAHDRGAQGAEPRAASSAAGPLRRAADGCRASPRRNQPRLTFADDVARYVAIHLRSLEGTCVARLRK